MTNGHFFYALVVRERFISPTIRSFRNQPKTAMKGKKIEPQLIVGSMAFTDPAADRQTMIKSSAFLKYGNARVERYSFSPHCWCYLCFDSDPEFGQKSIKLLVKHINISSVGQLDFLTGEDLRGILIYDDSRRQHHHQSESNVPSFANKFELNVIGSSKCSLNSPTLSAVINYEPARCNWQVMSLKWRYRASGWSRNQ